MSTGTALEARPPMAAAIQTARLFRGVSPAHAAALARHASLRRLGLAETLFWQDSRTEHFYVVRRGLIELKRRAPSGEPTLLALFGPGESPAVPSALEGRPFVADAVAATCQAEVLVVRRDAVVAAMEVDVVLALAVNRALLAHCRLLHAKIDVLAAGTVPQRLAAFFLDLMERFGDELGDGIHRLPLALSRQQIAAYVGARVETVIRCCSSWRRAGLLETTRDGFVLRDIEGLRAMAKSGTLELLARAG